MDPRPLFSELKRRKVFRVAVVYAVVAWAVIEVAETTAPLMGLPSLVAKLVLFLALLCFPLALVLAWAFEITPEGVKRTETPLSHGDLPGAAPHAEPDRAPNSEKERKTTAEYPPHGSIAVLPFVNFSSDPDNEYFSDGITEELIDRLVKTRGLRVAARTSSFAFKGENADIGGIGRALRVAHVLEGSVRKDGNRLRVTAQLVEIATGYHLWSETYERELRDVFAVQDEIGRAITGALQVELAPVQASSPVSQTKDVEAYNLYLKGRYFLAQRTKESMEQAIDFFESSTRRDPAYARAYAGLADAYLTLSSSTYGILSSGEAVARAEESAERALCLDEDLSEAHVSLGTSRMRQWDWSEAEARFARAVELDPGHADAHHRYGWFLAVRGEFTRARGELEMAEELDPLSLPIKTAIGRLLQFMRRPDEAIAKYRHALALDPNFAAAHLSLGLAFAQKEMYREGVAALQRARELTGDAPAVAAVLANVFALAGEREEARALLDDLLERHRSADISPAQIASIYAMLGDSDEAFSWWEKAVQERSPMLCYFKVEPLIDSFRSDPQFQDILRRIGLADTRAGPKGRASV